MNAKFMTAKDMEVLRRNPLFGGLPDETLNSLIEKSHLVEHGRGKILFLRGEPAKNFFLLLDGWVKMFRDTPDGEQTVISIRKSGDTIAEAAIFFGNNYPASAEVVDRARLLEIPASALLGRIRSDGELAVQLLGALSMRVHNLVHHIEQLQARSTSQRLGDFILGLCEIETGPADVRLPYDKSLIAARLGMKPESLSRALAKLKDIGVTSKGHMVILEAVERLREYCQVAED